MNQYASAAAVTTARQQCAKHSSTLGALQLRGPNSCLETSKEVRSHPLLIVGISMPDGDLFGLAVFARHVIRFKKRCTGG